MDAVRIWAWAFAVMFCIVVAVGYVPAFIDQDNMIFGLFRRTWYADGLHLASALWVAAAAAISSRASLTFFRLFGPLYFLDGVLGLLTGSGYLDFGILIYGFQSLPLATRFFANLPHLLIGGVALYVGYVIARREPAPA
jgi:hypothetical protein